MKTATAALTGLLLVVFLAQPFLAFAQADNESAEGNCNDEMSEGTGCGATTGSGSSYTAPSTYSYSSPSTYSYSTPSYSSYSPSSYSQAYQPTYAYSSPSSYSYPTQNYYSPSSYTQTYQPTYQTYTPTYGYSSSSYGNTYTSPYTSSSYSYPSYTTNNYGSGTYSPTSYGSPMSATANAYAQQVVQHYLTPPPQTTSIPTGTYSWGTELCYWSDYQGLAPCGSDPQQWIYDPYSGTWY